jgi:hypothetical protein
MLFATLARFLVLLAFLDACASDPAIPPYPKSEIIGGVDWDFSTYTSAAPGSDLWYATWCADDNLYASFGDGCGFGNCDQSGPHRASLGIARIAGMPPRWNGRNVWGGVDPISAQDTVRGKANGILCVDGTIYAFATKQDSWDRLRIISSADLGKTWNIGRFDFAMPLSHLSPVQFGKDYAGGPEYVYLYFFLNGQENDQAEHLGLARVFRTRIEERRAYEFFAGVDGTTPQWSKDISDREPAFSNVGGRIAWGFAAMYHPGIERYLLTARHNDSSGWGLYEAPRPWGPWKTAAYYASDWKDSKRKFTWILTQKWLEPDGEGFWMINSGHPEYDSYHHVRGRFRFRDGVVIRASSVSGHGAAHSRGSG